MSFKSGKRGVQIKQEGESKVQSGHEDQRLLSQGLEETKLPLAKAAERL